MLVALPLGSTSIGFCEDNRVKRETIQLAEDWMQGTGYGISHVQVSGDRVYLVIYGSGDRPLLSEFGERLNASLNEPVDLNLVVVPSLQEYYYADLIN